MRRIVVVGASCSGKTTLAQSIAQRLELPHFDMDSIVWGPNWSLPSDEQLLTQVKSIIQHEAWVIDGVFPEHRDLVWARADTIVWLNYPMTLVFSRALRRTLKRCITRQQLGDHNVETWRRTFFSSRSQLLWVIHSWRKRRRDYPKIFRRPENRHLRIFRFSSPRRAEAWLAALRPEPISPAFSPDGEETHPSPATWQNYGEKRNSLTA
ncbi:MAG: adenylate kinase [Tepidisphaeraceae bacterium]|jgi:adenylate kinase family enzyme